MSWTNSNKPNTNWSDGVGYLLTQALGYLLLEDGGRILLDQSFNNKPFTNWGLSNKPTTAWTNISK